MSDVRTQQESHETTPNQSSPVPAAMDDTAFTSATERYRHELRVHCYRLLGSFDDAEDLTQETFLRAWRAREQLRDGAAGRAWLYRIATNACLDWLRSRPAERRAMPLPDASERIPAAAMVPWLTPFPGSAEADLPDGRAVARETVTIALTAALQYLPPRQRAALILRDVVGWTARETAAALEISVAATNSATQRARATLRTRLPGDRLVWTVPSLPSDADRAVLARYMDAIDRQDDDALRGVLRDHIRVAHQGEAGGNQFPVPSGYAGRERVIASWAPILHDPGAPEMRSEPLVANGQPALASWIRMPGDPTWRAFSLAVMTVTDGEVAVLDVFSPAVFPAFGLPPDR